MIISEYNHPQNPSVTVVWSHNNNVAVTYYPLTSAPAFTINHEAGTFVVLRIDQEKMRMGGRGSEQLLLNEKMLVPISEAAFRHSVWLATGDPQDRVAWIVPDNLATFRATPGILWDGYRVWRDHYELKGLRMSQSDWDTLQARQTAFEDFRKNDGMSFRVPNRIKNAPRLMPPKQPEV